MKLKRFFKRGLQKAIANDFKNLVEDKSMAMPSGFLCYRYWDGLIGGGKNFGSR